MAIERVDLPTQDSDFPQLCNSLPESNHEVWNYEHRTVTGLRDLDVAADRDSEDIRARETVWWFNSLLWKMARW